MRLWAGCSTLQSDVSRTVLVVDDEQDILDSLQMLLEASIVGVRVVTARSGPEALGILRHEKVHLIVSDYKMPSMNGAEFLQRADEVAAGIPHIMISAFPSVIHQRHELERVRVDKFFPKPLDTDGLVEAMKSLLAQAA